MSSKKSDFEYRTLMVLQHEAARMTQCAERVRLVVQALSLRRGLHPTPDVDLVDQ